MNAFGIVLGLVLFICGVYLAASKNDLTDLFYEYYNRPRQSKGWRRFNRSLIKPTMERVRFGVWCLGAAGAVVGLIFFVLSLPRKKTNHEKLGLLWANWRGAAEVGCRERSGAAGGYGGVPRPNPH